MRGHQNYALVLFETSGMKAAFVDNLFYNYLDGYLSGTGTLNPVDVKNAWATKKSMLDGQFYQKDEVKCGTEPVDVCKIANDVNQLKNQ